MTSCNSAYKFPFIAAEILSSNNQLIIDSLFGINKEQNDCEDKKEKNCPNIFSLFKVLDNNNILYTTIPGYIYKIIQSHIKNKLLLDNIEKYIDNIFDILLKFIYIDSYRDILYILIDEAMNGQRKEYYKLIKKIFDLLIIDMKNYIKNNNLEENSTIQNRIDNIILTLIKLFKKYSEVYMLIINNLSDCEMLKNIPSKEENLSFENILKDFYCKRKFIKIFSNLLYVIISKKENNEYIFFKYYLTTIIEPTYQPFDKDIELINEKNKENADKQKNNVDNKEKEEQNNIDKSNQLLYNLSSIFIKNIYLILLNKIKKAEKVNKSFIVGSYNDLTDLLLELILVKKDIQNLNNNKNIDDLLQENFLFDLIQFIIDYPFCSIIHNKTLQIFLLLELEQISQKEKIIKYFENYFTNEKVSNLVNNGKLIYNGNDSFNNIFLIKIYQKMVKDTSPKIKEYLDINSKGLLENEKLSSDQYVPKPDEEEIIFQKKQDIHDSEAFIFTPKKVIEESKKIMKNLIEMDKV